MVEVVFLAISIRTSAFILAEFSSRQACDEHLVDLFKASALDFGKEEKDEESCYPA